MANVAQLNLTEKGAEARLRALLEDVVEFHVDIYPNSRLALAVRHGKPVSEVQQLLELFSDLPAEPGSLRNPVKFSLLWRTGSEKPPFVEIRAASVGYFSSLLTSGSEELARFFEAPEVLYFDTALLSNDLLKAFHIVTEPRGLIKGWYVGPDQYQRLKSVNNLLSSYSHLKPHIGLVKTYDPPDAENCRGLLHIEVDQRWVPLSLNGLKIHTFFNDLQQGRPGVFLFEGGATYRPLKFEEKNVPAYSELVLEPLPDDRYPEVYLRSVYPSE